MTPQSHIDLLKAKASFTDEPLWYRLVVIILMAGFLLLFVWLLKQWVLPFLTNSWLAAKLEKAYSFLSQKK
jgi:hypothetical protein